MSRHQNDNNNTSDSSSSNLKATLRLVSRWNVRRGATTADQWVVLPPPMDALGQPVDNRICHVFCDPTGSHTLLSAYNGECYYVHGSSSSSGGGSSSGVSGGGGGGSSSLHQRLPQVAVKLPGFGVQPDGTWPAPGVPATTVAHQKTDAAQAKIQHGLTVHSHVTAVAWDKERGTEGNSKTILLGTSAGEIYEYNLTAPDSSSSNYNEQHYYSSNLKPPVLLHRLYRSDGADPSEVGAAVTGLYLERLRTGLLVLAATSGRHKRTRLYTFYSAHSTSLRLCLADQQHASLQELPGSVDFADLRLCHDHFALRTQTGIYYGNLDRSLAGPAVLAGGSSSSLITDSGILPYSETTTVGTAGGGGGGSKSSSNSSLPVSLALTPHHIVTLQEVGHHQQHTEIRFINRVALAVVQKERVDGSLSLEPSPSHHEGLLASATTTATSTIMSAGGPGEFLMDIRRPDQIWLRKGRSLIHISSSQEDRDVWKFTLRNKCLADLATKSATTAMASSGSAPPSPPTLDIPSSSTSLWSNNGAAAATQAALTDEEKAQEALFEQAKSLCTNASQKQVVTAVRAEYHLQHGRGELAAKYLAQCPPSLAQFSDTAIRLALPKLGVDDPQGYGGSWKARACLESSNIPLITYLNEKMRLGSSNEDRMTCTMIGAWLTELFLHERGDHQMTTATTTEDGRSGSGKHSSHSAAAVSQAQQRALLAQFLNANVHLMDAKTIMKILTSHDATAAECASYAAHSGDIRTAVNAALSAGQRDSVSSSVLVAVGRLFVVAFYSIHGTMDTPFVFATISRDLLHSLPFCCHDHRMVRMMLSVSWTKRRLSSRNRSTTSTPLCCSRVRRRRRAIAFWHGLPTD